LSAQILYKRCECQCFLQIAWRGLKRFIEH
jgi:hypothetical protein